MLSGSTTVLRFSPGLHLLFFFFGSADDSFVRHGTQQETPHSLSVSLYKTVMLRRTAVNHASKVSGGSARNQAGAPRKKHKQFNVFLDTPVSPKEVLKEQRHRYGQDRHSRMPEYRPGHNVTMDKRFALRATVKGVVSIRRSRINPNYKWLDVEPDIQMVRRGNQIRGELKMRGQVTTMMPKNELYRAEYDKLMEPNWRERVLAVQDATDRFVDPNLFSRGIVPELKPLSRFCYE